MKPSLDCIAAARVALAEKMLRDSDPRYRAAFNELRAVMVEDEQLAHDSTRELIANSREVALCRRQA